MATSELIPTAVPIEAVVRFIVTRPPMANILYEPPPAMAMAEPKMYTKSSVNRTGWLVASDSWAGSRRTCTRFR